MPTKPLKISVCIVTFNHARYIEDCLSSVLGQQVNADLEILVGDDCSSDETRNIVSSFAQRYPDIVIPVFHPKNIGASHNYQYLINQADGDLIAHLDGDDFWLPGKLAAQMAYLEKNTQCVAVYANAIVISDGGELIARFNGKLSEEFTLDNLLRRGNFLNASSIMYRAKCKHALLKFKEEAIDFQYHLILANQGKLGYVNKVFVAYRKNSSTSMIASNLQLVLTRYWQAIMFARTLNADPDAIEQCALRFYRDLVFSAIARRDARSLRGWTGKIISDYPKITKWMLFKSLFFLPIIFCKEIMRAVASLFFKGGARILHDK